MSGSGAPTSAARPPLSRDAVLDRAVSLVDAEGLGAVTIRRLAGLLDVTPMALYWHFSTKDELVAGLGDRVLDAVRVPSPTDDWAADLRGALLALAGALRAHPRLVELVPDRLLEHPGGLALSETALHCLTTAGFEAASASYLALHALHTAIAAVTGDLAADTADAADGADGHDARRRRQQAALAALSPSRYPTLVAHAEAITHCVSTAALEELAVDMFVAGVQACAPSARAH